MGTMRQENVFSSCKAIKYGDGSINPVHHKKHQVEDVFGLDQGLGHKVAQKQSHGDTSHIAGKSFGLFSDIKEAKNQAGNSHYSQQLPLVFMNRQECKAEYDHQGI